jgi:hypothetical protein
MRGPSRVSRPTNTARPARAHWLELADGWAPLALVVICTLWAAVQLYFVAVMEEPPSGYEVERVAKMIAQDRGFSLPNDHRWLFVPAPGASATAWVDPVYAYALAGMYSTFGERAPEVALSLNIAAAVACFMLLFQLVQRFGGAFVAVIAVALLALHPWFRTITLGLNTATWAAFLVTLSALLMMRVLEKPTVLRALILGACSGITALTCSSTLLFIPAIAVLVVAAAPGRLPRRIAIASTGFVVACATVAPWTARNLHEFGEFVPVRTGMGQLAHVGTVMLGSTIAPESVNLPVHPGWYASTPRAAVRAAAGTDGRNALEYAQGQFYRRAPPPGFDQMNEAQRDRALLDIARDYVLENPLLTAVLGVFKLELFARRMGTMGVWILLVAYVSLLLLYRERKVLALGTLVIVYALPFALFITYFHRYRLPIEPLVVALATVGSARLAAWVAARRATTFNPRRWSLPGAAIRPATGMRGTTAAR